MNDDSWFEKIIISRFIIPLKILTGAVVAVLLLPILKPETDLFSFYVLVAECITYSLITCMLYMIGEYVFHVGYRIYIKITKKKDVVN